MNKIVIWFRRQSKKLRIIIIKVKLTFKRESKETAVAAKILIRLMKDESKVSDNEIKFLKEQGADIGKIVALIGLQLVPGSSIGIITLEKIGKKRGFTVFPKEHKSIESKDSSSQTPSS